MTGMRFMTAVLLTVLISGVTAYAAELPANLKGLQTQAEDNTNPNQTKAQYAFALGYALNHGGDQKGDEEAARWMRKSAELGLPKAQMLLGGFYEAGKGVGQDWEEAYFWETLSSIEGDYPYPESVAAHLTPEQKDAMNKRMIDCLHKIAELGSVNIQAILGAFYATGQYVQQDWTETYFLKSLVAKHKPDLTGERNKAASHLAAGQIIAVNKRVKEWKPIFGPAAVLAAKP